MITGNKGEWSEIYTLFKLLGDTVMYPGNEKIEKISNIIYPIIKILRSESNGDYEYSIKDNIVIISGNEEILKIPISLFKEKAIILLETIKTNSSGKYQLYIIKS
jgi:type II restriction enzyme